ncbi:uncharacterized protein LTR77_010705 [Saxophila tyrrhenica]|uniref:DUF1772-domain-containing protein n=1 Tax=Saxophila tyrrhenica TaxID=1690608 RepID=A0AAV9NYF3_9PEZI|nr:hypothetical protein LTR77_010705 [Saxophila tyrrhenica]
MSGLLALQASTITTSIFSSGAIATLSLFDIPELRSQPAVRSLPQTRWLFSRGSHIFPFTAFLSAAGFLSLAITALPPGRAISSILKVAANGAKVNSYLAAAVLNFAIAPWTSQVMIATNFRLIELNERLGGARSERSAKEGKFGAGEKSAEDSVSGKGDVSQVTDLSGPQERTGREASVEEEREVRELLGAFGRMNGVRAVLTGVGGVVGLVAALL